jgi:hypothetical protein
MTEWTVDFHGRFKSEVTDLPADVRVELLAYLVLLRQKGFRLKSHRPLRRSEERHEPETLLQKTD